MRGFLGYITGREKRLVTYVDQGPHLYLDCNFIMACEGYSSLAVALVLPESGHLVACKRDERCLEIARKYYELVGVSHKEVMIHPFLRMMVHMEATHHLIKNFEDGTYKSHHTNIDWQTFRANLVAQK